MKTSNNNTRGRGRGNKDGEQHELPSNIFTTQSSNSNLMNHNIHLNLPNIQAIHSPPDPIQNPAQPYIPKEQPIHKNYHFRTTSDSTIE
ncbi:uncharacterized protein OCT59_017040 [Rhizophagus irregularis]|uniref:uncharacterized protein n=1 Tax=Rhizophagus irregularis TaxID=588596 RepID=UPI001D3BFFA1|nr:hypothetical protein OCT59_017040 [Rhizophagus irregularis]CAG8642249.1 14174_t:CDS:2 [Rhizophagus irregularis]